MHGHNTVALANAQVVSLDREYHRVHRNAKEKELMAKEEAKQFKIDLKKYAAGVQKTAKKRRKEKLPEEFRRTQMKSILDIIVVEPPKPKKKHSSESKHEDMSIKYLSISMMIYLLQCRGFSPESTPTDHIHL